VSGRRPALILLLFAAARIPLLIVRAPFFDELFTRWISAKPFAGIVSALQWDSGPPLYYFAVHLLGDPPVAATRVLSLVCAAISLAVVILRGCEEMSEPKGTICHPEAAGGAEPKARTPEDDEGSQDAQFQPEQRNVNGVPAGAANLEILRRPPALRALGSLRMTVAPESGAPALLTALLLTVFPPAILFAADARAYALCAMFVTIAVLAIDDDRPFAAALALVAAAYSHYYGVLLFPILLLLGRRRLLALAAAVVLYIPGFLLAMHQPTEARAWMNGAWPDALFIRPPIALAIIGAIVFALSVRVNRYAAMVLIPLILAIALRVYVPMRFEAVIAAPVAMWLAESLKTNRFRVALTTALVSICVIWTTLGILDHASRPADPYRQAALWAAGNIPASETVVASGYCYLETMMNGHAHVAAFPPEQGMHPGWRALPKAGLRAPTGAFFWTGERNAPELAVIMRERRTIEPLFVNDRAMVALVR
jgi:hypothetical protein